MNENDKLFLEVIKVSSLLDVSLAINSQLTLDNIFDVTHDTLFANFRTDSMSLFMQREPLDRHYSKQTSFGNKTTTDARIKDDGKLATFFTTNRNPLIYAEMPQEIQQEITDIEKFSIQMIVPCFIREELSGFLFMGDKPDEEYSEKDKLYLKHLSQILGMALENARLIIASTYDAKTKLYLYQAAEVRIVKEIYRANRYQQPLSLMLLDIDHFKTINDSYGHVAGDLVLSVYGEILRATVRESDIAARFGGEEFLIACPCLPKEKAYQMAERIQQKIKEREFSFSGRNIHTTISIGISEYDNKEHSTFEALLAEADKALYRSKEDGRNRITIATKN